MPPKIIRVSRHVSLLLALAATSIASRPLCAQSASPSASADTTTEDPINADRPGIADGSRVIAPGQLQLEIGAQRERHTDADTRTTLSFAPTLFRIGITRHLEARIESNTFVHARTVTERTSLTTIDNSSGLSPILLGAKLALYDSHGDDDRLSIGTIVRVAPPSGTNGFNTSLPTGDIRVAADWDFAPELSLNPNAGAARYEGSDGSLFTTALGALTLTYQPTPRLAPFVDVAYQSREDVDATWSLVVDAGVAYIVGNDVQLDLSAGTGAHGDTTPRPFVALGISVRAAPFRRHAARHDARLTH